MTTSLMRSHTFFLSTASLAGSVLLLELDSERFKAGCWRWGRMADSRFLSWLAYIVKLNCCITGIVLKFKVGRYVGNWTFYVCAVSFFNFKQYSQFVIYNEQHKKTVYVLL